LQKNNTLKKAIQIVERAGKIALSLQKRVCVEYKGKINPVTSADKKTEKFLVENLSKLGDFGFFCEEASYRKIKEKTFVIDPIDGTVNYFHKNPFWAVSVCFVENFKPVFGITFAPQLNEMFWAEKGKGSFLNGRRISVSKIRNLKRALLTTGFPYYVWERPHRVIRIFKKFLTSAQGIRRPGSATIDLAYVACGRYDGFWEEGLYPWDIATGMLLVEEAGGRISDYYGNKIKISEKIQKDRTILATNKLLHKPMLEKLK